MSHIAALYTDHDSTPYQHLHRPAEDPHTPDLSGGASSAGTSVTLVPATAPAVTTRDDDEDEDQCKCWICFGEDSDSEGRWVRPCKCSLISHEECLLNWISENQKGIPFKKVRCPQCNMVYQLQERSSLLLWFMSRVDATIQASIPYMTVLGLTCSVLITSTTYGAYAVLTICGTDEGERLLGSPQPWGWRVWVGLPLIPVILVASRTTLLDSFMPLVPLFVMGNEPMRGWVEGGRLSPAVTLSILPWVRLIYSGIYAHIHHRLEVSWTRATSSPLTRTGDVADRRDQREEDRRDQREEDLIFRDRREVGRTIVGALLMPAVSSLVGGFLSSYNLIRTYVPDTFHRNILGGCLFVVVKDIANLLYKYQRLRQRRSRHVRNYDEYRDEIGTGEAEAEE